MKVKLADLKLGKNYSRTFGTGDISEQVSSMKEHGQITPVIVDDQNRLVAGFRRYHAAKELGWEEIDAVICKGNPKIVNLIENMNRTELTLWEEIQAIRDVFGTECSQGEIARQLSKSRPWVEPRVKVWELPQDFIDRVRLGVAGVNEIRKRLRGRTKTNASTGGGKPNQEQLKDTITKLMQQGRDGEAKALSYALGAISQAELLGHPE